MDTSLIPDTLHSSAATYSHNSLGVQPRAAADQLKILLSPEEDLLVSMVTGRYDPAVFRKADWPALTVAAARLGMLGHLARRAEEFSLAGVPGSSLAACVEAWRGQTAFNLLLAHTEKDWLGVLAARGITAIPLKGVSLSRILYRSPAVRSTTDVDLLVPAAQMSTAAEIFEERGYRSALPRALLSRRAFLSHTDEHTAETVYVAERGGIPVQVELHWKILPLQEKTIWNSLVEYDAEGGAVRGLSQAPYLLYLCAHLAGHGWRSLHWLADIAAFLEKFSGRMDAAEFLGHCDRARFRHRVGVTFALLEAYFGMQWQPAKSLVTVRARRAAEGFLRRPLEPASTPGVLEVHRERLRQLDGGKDRLRYLSRLARPTREEWAREDGSLRTTAAAWAIRARRLLNLANGENKPEKIVESDFSSSANRHPQDPAERQAQRPLERPRGTI
ncbi:MAG: nucleotidyltransferase family protein [Acidipila sp.]|nr:nucleotidyltransferase family protein [Acidipila sp.]